MKYVMMLVVLLGAFSCDDDTVPSGECGNGIVDGSEECDGLNLEGYTCKSWGYYGGTLGCKADCTFDRSSCEASGICGDGMVQQGEECDGSVSGVGCDIFHYGSGELSCGADCLYDLSGCSFFATCGNNYKEQYEECDGENLGGATCEDFGYHGDGLTCTAGCRLDLTLCRLEGACGDGHLDEGYEECDRSDTGGKTCQSLGFYGGAIGCSSDCTFNTAQCEGCGDGVVQSFEQCDTQELQGQSCESLGYYGGELSCSDHCLFDTLDCQDFGRCGDGIIQPRESCDGTQFGGATCQDLGFHGGELGCNGICQVVYAGCAGFCGDGILQAEAGESCDGTHVPTCQEAGFPFGQSSCNMATCQLATGSCSSVKRFGFSSYDYGYDMMIDSTNRLLIGGQYNLKGVVFAVEILSGEMVELMEEPLLPLGQSMITSISEVGGQYYFGGVKYVENRSNDMLILQRDASLPLWYPGSVVTTYGSADLDALIKLWVSDDGSRYLGGLMKGDFYTYVNRGLQDGVLLSLDGAGTLSGQRFWGTSSVDMVVDFVRLPNGKFYVLGTTEGDIAGSIGGRDCFLSRVSSSLQVEQTIQFGTGDSDSCSSIATDGTSLYVAGGTYGAFPGFSNSGASDAFLLSFDPFLQSNWRQQLGSPESEAGSRVIVGPSGGIYVGGITLGNLDGNGLSTGKDAFVARYGADGSLSWVKQGGAGEGGVLMGGLVYTLEGYILALVNSDGSFGGISSNGQSDIYLWGVPAF